MCVYLCGCVSLECTLLYHNGEILIEWKCMLTNHLESISICFLNINRYTATLLRNRRVCSAQHHSSLLCGWLLDQSCPGVIFHFHNTQLLWLRTQLCSNNDRFSKQLFSPIPGENPPVNKWRYVSKITNGAVVVLKFKLAFQWPKGRPHQEL